MALQSRIIGSMIVIHDAHDAVYNYHVFVWIMMLYRFISWGTLRNQAWHLNTAPCG
jgi:hypothetical protein